MIVLDLPLILLSIFFFLISWAYGWGLVHFFGDKFRWSLAAVTGIASVISCTYVFVWQVRGIEPLQAVFDLAIVFLAALPGMTYVDYKLKEKDNKIFGAGIEYGKQAYLEEFQELRIHTREILERQKEIQQTLQEAMSLWGMRREAEEYLKQYQKNLN